MVPDGEETPLADGQRLGSEDYMRERGKFTYKVGCKPDALAKRYRLEVQGRRPKGGRYDRERHRHTGCVLIVQCPTRTSQLSGLGKRVENVPISDGR